MMTTPYLARLERQRAYRDNAIRAIYVDAQRIFDRTSNTDLVTDLESLAQRINNLITWLNKD